MTIAEIAYAVGATIAVGVVGGSVFYFVKGALRSSSEGYRLAGGVQAVVVNEPRVRRWAAWLGVQAAIECGMRDARRVDDPLNMVVSWAAANALLSLHRGPRAAVREGLKGAAYGGAAWFAVTGIEAVADALEAFTDALEAVRPN